MPGTQSASITRGWTSLSSRGLRRRKSNPPSGPGVEQDATCCALCVGDISISGSPWVASLQCYLVAMRKIGGKLRRKRTSQFPCFSLRDLYPADQDVSLTRVEFGREGVI
ncbi:hypothetical protein K474DRAFT_884154 [Panus rudis PR-1116 ss-1]|nr:hypothetical protein K474DRAFT_884154 [Panus rudis PR-1116 ss-1]